MKTKLLIASLALFGTAFAADASKILLMGKSFVTEGARVSGDARAVVGDMTVSGDSITFDRQANVLKCEGAVSIKVGGSVVKTTGCVIELSGGEKSVYILNPNGITIQPSKSAEPTTGPSPVMPMSRQP